MHNNDGILIESSRINISTKSNKSLLCLCCESANIGAIYFGIWYIWKTVENCVYYVHLLILDRDSNAAISTD